MIDGCGLMIVIVGGSGTMQQYSCGWAYTNGWPNKKPNLSKLLLLQWLMSLCHGT